MNLTEKEKRLAEDAKKAAQQRRMKEQPSIKTAERKTNVCAHCKRRIDPGALRVPVEKGFIHSECEGRMWCTKCKKEIEKDAPTARYSKNVHEACELVSAPRAAEILGVSVHKFRKIIELLGLSPDKEVTNWHHRSGPKVKVYAHGILNTLQSHPLVVGSKKQKKQETPEKNRYWERFESDYEGDPSKAIPDACEALFNLNRYTRHETCSSLHRTEIHLLKTKLIQHLYHREIYTDRVEKLTKVLPEKKCFGCDGINGWFRTKDCDRCRGTGIYLPKKIVVFYMFKFTVADQHYCWIQPEKELGFEPKVEETRQMGETPLELDTEMNIPRNRLAEAKALIRYVLNELLH